jgi:hypothetical protein
MPRRKAIDRFKVKIESGLLQLEPNFNGLVNLATTILKKWDSPVGGTSVLQTTGHKNLTWW